MDLKHAKRLRKIFLCHIFTQNARPVPMKFSLWHLASTASHTHSDFKHGPHDNQLELTSIFSSETAKWIRILISKYSTQNISIV